MHMPLIKRLFEDNNKVKVVPIIVGVIDDKLAEEYGKRFASYFDDQNTIFIVSSDFCHWGPHFAYQPYKEGKQIHEYISELDHQGMNLIEKNDTKAFDKYIQDTGNTICGEFPIRILMHTIKNSKMEKKLETKFVKYDQSDKVKSFNGSSVSYAAGVTYLK